jgi:ATP-binding cassette, subfamily B, bacterial
MTAAGLIMQAYFNLLTGDDGWTLSLGQVVVLQASYFTFISVTMMIAVLAHIAFKMRVTGLLIRNLFGHILTRPGADALPRHADGTPMGSGQIISTMRDDTEGMVLAMTWIEDMVGLIIMTIISIWIMARISVVVTVGTFLPLFMVVFIAQRLEKRIKQYRAAARQATSNVTGLIADMFTNTQAIKVGDAEERIVNQFRRLNDARRQAMVKDRVLAQLIDTLNSGTVNLGMGLVLLLAAQAMYQGAFTVGDFALFAAYMWPVTNLMRMLSRVLVYYRQADVAVERMERITANLPPGSVTTHRPLYLSGNAPQPVYPAKTAVDYLDRFEAHEFELHYPGSGGNGRFRHQSLYPTGEFVVITGQIGSGKTTLLRLLLGLLPADSGQLYWNGELITSVGDFMIPPRVAYTGQIPRLFSESLRDNILLGLPVGDEAVRRAVDTAVLTPDVAQMEQGLDTLVGPRGMRLSGGQVQRTAAARMFVRQAELLVVDDLSSALDVETERTLWQNIGQSTTCLVVSHRRPALERADRIVLLENGRITASGPLDQLLTHNPTMRRLWQQEKAAE